MNNRRWYPVSRLAPEQIKVLKHSMDPSMTVLLPGVETATAYGCKLVSYHRGGEDQSRVDIDLPVALLADEHHQGLDGQKVYIATTVGNGCCLGAEPAEAAGSDKLKVAYQVFKDEACDVSPKYAPKTVSTDGWKGTQAAWKMLFTKVV